MGLGNWNSETDEDAAQKAKAAQAQLQAEDGAAEPPAAMDNGPQALRDDASAAIPGQAAGGGAMAGLGQGGAGSNTASIAAALRSAMGGGATTGQGMNESPAASYGAYGAYDPSQAGPNTGVAGPDPLKGGLAPAPGGGGLPGIAGALGAGGGLSGGMGGGAGAAAMNAAGAANANPMNKDWIISQVLAQGKKMQDAGQYVDPSVFNDPGYWAGVAQKQGGWVNGGAGHDNIGYLTGRMGEHPGDHKEGGGLKGLLGLGGSGGGAPLGEAQDSGDDTLQRVLAELQAAQLGTPSPRGRDQQIGLLKGAQ
jgi:hypothetical protein